MARTPKGNTSARTRANTPRPMRGTLLRAARKVFEDRGYHDAGIADITGEAGVAVGSFYRHFDSKQDLFRQLLITIEDEVYGELLVRDVSSGPAARIRATNQLYLRSFAGNARMWRAIEEAALTDATAQSVLKERRQYYRSRTLRALQHWQDTGLIPGGVDIEFAAQALGAMTERCAYLWFVLGDPSAGIEEEAENLTTMWLKALGVSDTGSD